jgi:hypothetical protein
MIRRFLFKLFLFALLVGCSMEVSFFIAQKLEKPYFTDGKYAWVTKLPRKPKIVLMGSSTVLNNLSPREIMSACDMQSGEVINLGGGSRGPLQSVHIWRELGNVMDSVKYVVVSVDPWLAYSAYYWIEDFPTVYWNPVQRMYPAFVNNWPRYVMSGAVATDVMKKSAQHALHIQAPNLAVPHDFGGEVLDIHLKNYREHTREYFGPVSLFPISSLYLDRMRELKTEVEKRGAQFILLLTPKKRIWREEYARDCIDIDSDFVNHLSAALGPVRVIGSFALFSEDSALAQGDIEDSLFMDHVHLSGKGQKRLSDYVAEQLKLAKPLSAAPLHSLSTY